MEKKEKKQKSGADKGWLSLSVASSAGSARTFPGESARARSSDRGGRLRGPLPGGQGGSRLEGSDCPFSAASSPGWLSTV